MALIINHNLTAMTASRFLNSAYGKLSKSIERLSSGLRINTSGDDPAGMAVRELMRSDIAAGIQGIRNVSDAISMIQTADGALDVIDQKLIRMKTLAEQAATGTYTDVQRELINSEYQAMATEIDRLANSSNFNGVRLLDGSMASQNGGLGIRIHFGAGNSAAEDYYYIRTGDVRATSDSGLRIGGDGNNDIWSAGPYEDFPGGCCGGGIMDLGSTAVATNSNGFAYGYNWDGNAASEQSLFNSRYLAGRYGSSGDSYQELINKINAGTQSRVVVNMSAALGLTTGNYISLCLGDDEIFYRVCGSNTTLASMICGKIHNSAIGAGTAASTFSKAINGKIDSKYWALASGTSLIIFRKDGGDYNNTAVEYKFSAPAQAASVLFVNAETGVANSSIMTFALGGQHWGEMVVSEQSNGGNSLTLLGKDIGDGMDLFITGGALAGTDSVFSAKLVSAGFTAANLFINTLRRTAFTEIQDASDARWSGAEIRTQEAGQKALIAVADAISRKDAIRAGIGAIQNTLEGMVNSLTIQVENLQAAESRISDVDVASEMTEFTKNNILVQAATAMLAQANSMGALALTLING
jgi:flagellin